MSFFISNTYLDIERGILSAIRLNDGESVFSGRRTIQPPFPLYYITQYYKIPQILRNYFKFDI